MKTTFKTLLNSLAIVALTLPAVAADKPDDSRLSQRERNQRQAMPQSLGQVVKASDVIGGEVKNLQDQKIGKIDDMIVDVETGRILEVFVSSGGVLGIGDKIVAVPPQAFTCQAPHPKLVLDATTDKIKAAPAVDPSGRDNSLLSNRLSETYRHFGKEPYFTPAGRLDDKSSAFPTRVERASKLIGMAIRNEGDEKLGKVDNLMVDVEAGRIVHVVLSAGGFLGLGDDLYAMPPTLFRTREPDSVLIVNASKDTFTSAPRFKANEWPDFGDPLYSVNVYRAYRVEPYFNADNTRRNVRDRDSRTLTPIDQGTSAADLDTTRRIRKEILELKNLSVNGRNVKVITVNGRVTLRGPVNTEGERRAIEEIVARIASGATVDNQLEVKQPENP